MPSNHLILCHPLFLPPSVFPSIRVFSNESALRIRWPKYWSFSFSISPSNEHSGLISFRMDWLGLFAVWGTLKSFLQHHSSKASVLWHSAFLIVQLSHPYITAGKTIALTRQTFVGKVMSLLFNMLSGLVVTFLPRRNRLLISWLQSPSAVILEPPKIKSVTICTVSPSISHEVMGPDAMILVSFKVNCHYSLVFLKNILGSLYLLLLMVVYRCLFWRVSSFNLRVFFSSHCSSSLLLLFSHSVVSDSLRPHELERARLPCPSPSPGAYSNSGPLSRWCHPTILPLSSPSPPAFSLSQCHGLF